MRRRDFLKGVAAVAVVAIAPPFVATATPPSKWLLVAEERVIRDRTNVYAFQRWRGNECQRGELAISWEEKVSLEQVRQLMEEVYP